MPKELEILVQRIRKELKEKNNPRTNKLYTDEDVYAIATAQWKKKSKEYHSPKNQIIESYNAISVTEGLNNPTSKSNVLKIKGVAINAGVSLNNVNYVEEELKANASSLIGVPIMKNHSNMVEDIVGRVTHASYEDANKRVVYAGDLMDPKTIEMVKDGRLNQVSIRAKYDSVEESLKDEGVLTVRGLKFLELSTVAIAGDPKASLNQDFNSFVMEDYNKNVMEDLNNMVEEVKKAEEVISLEKLKEENAKLVKEIETMKVKKEEPKKVEPVKEEPKEDDKAEMESLKMKVKHLEESLAQGKGEMVKTVEAKTVSEFVKELIPGQGMSIYKKGVI